MSAPAFMVGEMDDVKMAAKILSERRTKRQPVIDDKGMLIGIVSRAIS